MGSTNINNTITEHTLFQKERDNLLNNILQGIEQVNTNMALLSKNLDSVTAVGKDFENVAALWKSFNSTIIIGGTDADLKEKNNN
ncbi:2688_t:CDS:2 [Ambispora gerdemannii]|uniref:DASH complex subunit DAD1 n=1 Tax=Ambispora gerdemannii TaxID=144530 RepID=A0A9N8V8I3_9GLOM|nr:2688_t:CDS:2 [Ambispora gerdemannii]